MNAISIYTLYNRYMALYLTTITAIVTQYHLNHVFNWVDFIKQHTLRSKDKSEHSIILYYYAIYFNVTSIITAIVIQYLEIKTKTKQAACQRQDRLITLNNYAILCRHSTQLLVFRLSFHTIFIITAIVIQPLQINKTYSY